MMGASAESGWKEGDPITGKWYDPDETRNVCPFEATSSAHVRRGMRGAWRLPTGKPWSGVILGGTDAGPHRTQGRVRRRQIDADPYMPTLRREHWRVWVVS